MKIVCGCGNEMEFNKFDKNTGEENFYTEGEGQFVTVDSDKFSFWQAHDVVGMVCQVCERDIWLFT